MGLFDACIGEGFGYMHFNACNAAGRSPEWCSFRAGPTDCPSTIGDASGGACGAANRGGESPHSGTARNDDRGDRST
jgi:hypothetical protein